MSHQPVLRLLPLAGILFVAALFYFGSGAHDSSYLTPAVLRRPRAEGSVYSITQEQVATYEREFQRRLQHVEENKQFFAPPFFVGFLWIVFSNIWPCAPLERIGGVMDGGKWTCGFDGLVAHSDCTVFSLGSNGDPSFEQAVLDRAAHCKVHTFDHTLTPAKTAAVNAVPAISLHPLGYTSESKLAAAERSGAQIGGYPATSFTSLQRAMAANNVTWIDILKIDIEGEEWLMFSELLAQNYTIPITQVYIEFHCCDPNRDDGGWPDRGCPGDRSPADFFTFCPSDGTRADFLAAFFNAMNRHGFRAYQSEMNPGDAANCIEYSFIHTDVTGAMVTRAHHKEPIYH